MISIQKRIWGYSLIFLISVTAFVMIYIGSDKFIISSFACGLMRIQTYMMSPVAVMIQRIASVRSLYQEVEQLREEKHALQAELLKIYAGQKFTRDTEQLCKFHERYTDYQSVLAHIVLKHCSPQGNFFLVDVGSINGVVPDMIAVFKNCLIGKVVQVFPYYSKIALITDRSCKVSVFCAKTRTEGIYEGNTVRHAGSLQHISHYEKLEVDDLLITSGQGLVFPRGFGVGRIESFKISDVYYEVQVKPLLDLKTISYCYLMLKSSPNKVT